MDEVLSPRRERILKLVVEEYVTTAQPVSSDALVQKYVPKVSSATIRNELAALEGFGYLFHPHTSSGRVPSDLGYRYYVKSLMGGARLSDNEERLISHQFHQVELDVREWVRLAASVLASKVQNPVVVSAPVAHTARARHLDFVKIGTSAVLVVVVLQSGAVRQHVLRPIEDFTPETLDELATEWNGLFVGKSGEEIEKIELPDLGASRRMLRNAILLLMHRADQEFSSGTTDVQIAGISYMAGQPEFGTVERFQPVLEALEHGILQSMVEPLLQAEGVYVVIGEEQPIDILRDCAVILASYGRQGEMLGVVGVIGPTRLPYWRAVPMVSFTAGILDQLLESTFLSS
jgi:heat-inducible transcriptional repressor